MSPPEPFIHVGGVPNSGAWAVLCRILLGGRPDPLLERLGGPCERLIVVREREEDLEDVQDGIKALAPLFPGQEGLEPAYFGEDAQARLASLERLHRGARIVLATAAGLRAGVPAPESYGKLRLSLTPGRRYPRKELLVRLAALGYRKADFVESPGEYAARGAVVDFFPLEPLEAVRVLYDGDVIESLRHFDPLTQSGFPDFLDEAVAVPATEDSSTLSLGEVLAQGPGTWLADESELPTGLRRALRVLPGAGGDDVVDFGASGALVPGAGIEAAAARFEEWLGKGLKVLLFSMTRGEDERVQDLIEDRLPEEAVQFLIGPLRDGFLCPRLGLAAVTSGEIFGRSYRASRVWKPVISGRAKVRWGELRKGDFVVHERYGIGRYLGLEAIETSGGPRTGEERPAQDCLKLEFRSGDILYVPMNEFRSVQKYIGAEGHRPRLSSLDTRSWEDVVERVREGVRELATELLKLQAERQALPGHAFPSDSRMEAEFAESFPFEETPDQAKAIAEVLQDLQSPHPMDRVVVGDVGFGKTEVAMRAALKCAAGLKQVAVLAPTTVLADQHTRTFQRRFAEYPVRVEMLSRFQTKAEQRKVLQAVAAGSVDIVVGTHRLLQPDVKFKDLGLVVIDEEHRFGVKDKERLKALRKNVDCLALSATPIPRTLHQCMSGLRQVSLIRSAPVGRQPIITQVRPFDEKHAAVSIQAEIERGGQVFYIHNRVSTLPQTVQRLQALLPGVRFVMAHGQMRSDALEKAMWDFFSRRYDVLVASTIIESGLDIPSVNTLLVEDAQDFGLSQLYQIRGRIGRERQRAYCTLYYPAELGAMRDLNEEARKRLEALREFGELGSGFNLALRDLEIRGAGDLLGHKQHGFLNAVGVEFYSELVTSEIERLKGKKSGKPETPVQLDLSVPAYIPEDYLPGDLERIQFYKRLLDVKLDHEGLEALRRELVDMSGPLPLAVENLFHLMRIRSTAARLRVRDVVQRGSRIEIYFRPDAEIPVDVIQRWMGVYREKVEFIRSAEGDGIRVQAARGDPMAWIADFLQGLEKK